MKGESKERSQLGRIKSSFRSETFDERRERDGEGSTLSGLSSSESDRVEVEGRGVESGGGDDESSVAGRGSNAVVESDLPGVLEG